MKSGDRERELTAEPRSRGENHVFSDHPITQSRAITRSLSLYRTLLAALREIFDESAYDRFLLRTNASRTAASYRAFTRERDAAMLKKPRCC